MPDVELRRGEGGQWLLTVPGYTEASAVGGLLWPSGVPQGVSITADMVVTQPSPIGTFGISGLNLSAVQAMEPQWGNWFATQVMVPQAPESAPSQPAQPVGQEPAVRLPKEMTREEAESKWKEFLAEGTHTAGEFASWIVEEVAEQGSRFLTFWEGFAGPAGDVLMLYNLFKAVIEAFELELKLQKRHGFVFGAVWAAAGMSPKDPTEDMARLPSLHTFDERKDAFNDGVKEGRDWVYQLDNWTAVAARIGYHKAKNGGSFEGAAQDTLTELGHEAGWDNGFELIITAPTV